MSFADVEKMVKGNKELVIIQFQKSFMFQFKEVLI